MEPPFLATELRKLLLWLTLECFRRNWFENRSIGLKELVDCLQNDRKWAWLLKIRARQYIRTPLLEILDPPLTIYTNWKLLWQPKLNYALESHCLFALSLHWQLTSNGQKSPNDCSNPSAYALRRGLIMHLRATACLHCHCTDNWPGRHRIVISRWG